MLEVTILDCQVAEEDTSLAKTLPRRMAEKGPVLVVLLTCLIRIWGTSCPSLQLHLRKRASTPHPQCAHVGVVNG